MSVNPPHPASHRVLVISGIVAAVAVTLCALVASAYLLGWLPVRANISTPIGMASPGQQAAGTAPGVALLPGETVVTPETTPAPTTPATRCENCGTVASTTAYPDRWEVRVRFEDGTSQIVRYRNPPDLRIGQRVRLEDGRLMRDD